MTDIAETNGTATITVRLPKVRQLWIYRKRLPITAVCMLTGLVLAWLSPPRIPIGGFLNSMCDGIAYLFLFTGIGLRLWSAACIDSQKTVKLVDIGPYSLCRNPLYVGTFLILSTYLWFVQSMTLFALTIPVLLLYVWAIVPAEERVMKAHHQLAFDRYCDAVPRWFPHPGGFRAGPHQVVWTNGLRRELECSLWWIGLAFAIQLMCHLRTQPWWHHPLSWP